MTPSQIAALRETAKRQAEANAKVWLEPAAVVELLKDVERYQWLRDNHESDWAICEWAHGLDGIGFYRDSRSETVVDAAIDAAMKGTK